MATNSNAITDGCAVILMKGNYMQCCKVLQSRSIMVGKARKSFQLSFEGIVGEQFGTTFRMINIDGKRYKLEKMSLDELMYDSVPCESAVSNSGFDNRHLSDDGSSQRLTREEILSMRTSGATGEEVIQAITSNSTTFNSKTKYSQEKYVKKKGKKYSEAVTLHRPTIDLLAEMFYSQSPVKIANMRPDTLFQLLCQSNVSPGSRTAVFDCGTMKLATAALLHRVGPQGRLVDVGAGFQNMNGTAMAFMNFSDEHLKAVSFIEIHRLHNVLKPGKPTGSGSATLVLEEEDDIVEPVTPQVEESAEIAEGSEQEEDDAEDAEHGEGKQTRKRKFTPKNGNLNKNFKMKFMRSRSQTEAVSRAVLEAGVTSLVVAHRHHPTVPTLALLPYLLPGCPFVVFCPYHEPLMELYQELKSNGGTNLQLSETWYREYQVLPERTHPEVYMSGGGGYLLRGTKIVQGKQL